MQINQTNLIVRNIFPSVGEYFQIRPVKFRFDLLVDNSVHNGDLFQVLFPDRNHCNIIFFSALWEVHKPASIQIRIKLSH